MNNFIKFIVIIVFISCKENTSKYIEVTKENKDLFPSTKTIPDSLFVGDETCKTCHKNQFKQWKSSHHDKAMEIANDTTVLASFNNQTYKSNGVRSRFFKKENQFYVNTEGPDGTYNDYKIEYTFGVFPLQQYIVKFPNGHYQCLRTAWDVANKKWFDLYPQFKIIHKEWLHWTRGGLNWNTMCSDCHSTNVRKNYNDETNSYHTKYALINVSCESCHGPGKAHAEGVLKGGTKYDIGQSLKMTQKTPAKELVDACARCHMRRTQISEHFNFEGTLLDHYFPQLITTDTYHPDGQILDEDYEYGSFLQSKMYQHNVTCTNCHNPHSLKLKFEGNALCLQCHDGAKFNSPKHHKHTMQTAGAACVNCHMPGKYYMQIDFRHDHSLRIPRPDLSLKYGTPNACVQCHTNKTNAWAWKHYQNLYKTPVAKHFSELLAPGLTNDFHRFENLMELAKDTSYPAIARASAVNGFSLNSEAEYTQLLQFLSDKEPLVKGAILDVLGNSNNALEFANYYFQLLNDSKRAIRVKAFNALAGFPEHDIPQDYASSYKKVKVEFETELKINADFVGGLVKKAHYELRKGNLNAAITCYERAQKMDTLNNMVRTNLANLYYQNRNYDKAEKAFKLIIKQEPQFGETYFQYALMLDELNRTNMAIEQMQLAIKYMPNNLRLYYNLGLMYNKIKAFDKAENVVITGLKIAPTNDVLLYALAYIYYGKGDILKAKNYALKLVQLYPNNTEYSNFYNQIK